MSYYVLTMDRFSVTLRADSRPPLCRWLHDWHEQQPLLSHITGWGCA